MPKCIFCDIVKSKSTCFTIYETRDFLAFLDMVPLCEGHTLVIPKRHYEWVWDIKEVGRFFEVCQKIADHFREITKNDMVICYATGKEVPHAHMHILPPTPGHERFFTTSSKHDIIALDCRSAQRIVKKYKLQD